MHVCRVGGSVSVHLYKLRSKQLKKRSFVIFYNKLVVKWTLDRDCGGGRWGGYGSHSKIYKMEGHPFKKINTGLISQFVLFKY